VDEEQLVSALKRQDPESLGQLVDLAGERLLRSAYLLCGQPGEAEDLVQETFLQALKAAHRFRGQSSLYTWLHGILLNLSRHYHRDQGRMVYDDQLVASQEAAAPANAVLETDFQAASDEVQKALRQLPGPLREVLVLRFYEEMKLDEIAGHLGVPRGTVKSRLHYALKQMRQLLPGELNLFGPQGTELTKRK
jgi:RNA polymerase sigma-70 factor, ECF subfamily